MKLGQRVKIVIEGEVASEDIHGIGVVSVLCRPFGQPEFFEWYTCDIIPIEGN